MAGIVSMEKKTLLRHLPFLNLPGEKGRLQFDQSSTLILITSPLLLGMDKETASATPLTEVSIPLSSGASVILVSVIYTE